MWDVKRKGSIELDKIEVFYLDYVGCKVDPHVWTSIYFSLFYLDYVGCKVYVEIQYTQGQKSFISTMWDVKYETAITMDGQIVFYLDYVGCKDS